MLRYLKLLGATYRKERRWESEIYMALLALRCCPATMEKAAEVEGRADEQITG